MDAPLLQVCLVVGIMFVIVNLSLSRLSRRLEIRARRRTGVEVEEVVGVEDQLALAEAGAASGHTARYSTISG